MVISSVFSSSLHAQSQFDNFSVYEDVNDITMPFDPDDANDSEFLKHLLLSHGLELQLDQQGKLGQKTYSQLVNGVGNADVRKSHLLSNVSERFTLSLWSEPRESELILADTDISPPQMRVIWWQEKSDSFDTAINKLAKAKISSDLILSEHSLLNSSGISVTDSLTQRLQSAGYDVDFGEHCQPRANQVALVIDWIESGKLPPGDSALKRAPQFLLDVYDSGVSREWNVIWLDCPDGVRIIRLPDQHAESTPTIYPLSPVLPSIKKVAPVARQSQHPIPDHGAQPSHASESDSDDESSRVFDTLSPTDIFPNDIEPDGLRPFDNNRDQSSEGGRPLNLVELNDDVPAGFEALAGPQFVYVDIYFNDQLIGATGVMASPEDVIFDDPAEVADLMSEVVKSDDLIDWLSAPLPSNGHLACFAENDPAGCGQMTGDPLAVIYNEVFLRVDIFVDQAQQSIKEQKRQRHLPSPERRNTAVFSVYGLASEFDGGDRSIDLSARALLGYGRGHVTAEADYSDELSTTRIRELKLTHYLNDYELVAGTYAYHAGGGLPDIDLIGAGFGTSFKTRVDLEHAFSSQLVVYLSTRSIVQLVVDDRIQTGDSYAAGNQVLDTSALPDGTYEVEIRIVDPVAGTRSERRIFTKSTQIPPHGEAVVNVTAGAVLVPDNDSSVPEASDVNVVGVSYTRRLTDQSAYRLGLLQFGSQSFAQTEFLYLGSNLSYQVTASVGESGTLAAGMQAGFGIHDVAFNLSGSFYETDFQSDAGSVESMFFLSDFSQISLSASRVFDKYTLGARTSVRRETNDENDRIIDRQYSIFAQKPLFRRPGKRGFVGTRFQRTEDEQRAEITVDVFFGSHSWTAALGSKYVDSSQAGEFWQADASLGWLSPQTVNGQLRSDAYIEQSEQRTATGLRLELEHPWFRASAATDQSNERDQEASSRNSIASLSAHFGVDRRGAGMGGSDFAQAGVIIDVSGEPDGAGFDVEIDGIRISAGKIGKQQFIGLQPFRRYELKLIPRTILGNGIADNVYNFTLFPGGVHRVTVIARRQLLLIASIVDENSEFITNAVVQSERNTLIISDDSILQVEVYTDEIMSVRLKDGRTCNITVPNNVFEDVVVVDEPLVCRSFQ